MTFPFYSELERSLERVDSPFGAAGAHGILCGVLSVDMGFPERAWLAELGIDARSDDALQGEAARLWRSVVERTRAQICDPDLGFFLLLPGDDAVDAAGRTQALADWCDGLLYGLALAGLSGTERLQASSRGFLTDVTQIARASVGEQPDEGDEVAYTELVEYLRIGVLLLSEELQPLQGPDALQ